METLILASAEQDRNQYYGKKHSDGFNCRTTSPIPIASSRGSQILPSEFVDKRRSLSYSELWAGPTYSNSPPPTSLPMPNFSLRQNRTVSQAAKSPTSCAADNPFHTTVSATMTLRKQIRNAT
ncbi:Uncharacterized protein Rs2_04934 [Raphanus sativus]|nr:Uncharacterized protein Rs2_04934 [Raphanus sativus]